MVHDLLVTGGHPVVCPPLHLEVEIEGGAIESDGRGQREMTFHDPDGVLANLIEMDPTSDR